MKCQKCDYVGFEYRDTCAKCGADLTEQKEKFGIHMPSYRSLGILEFLAKGKSVEEEAAPAAVEEAPADVDEHQKKMEDLFGEDTLGHDINLSEAGGHEAPASSNEEAGLDISSGEEEVAVAEGAGSGAGLDLLNEAEAAPTPEKGEIEIKDLDFEAVPPEPAKSAVKEVDPAELEGLDIDLGDLDLGSGEEEKKDEKKKKEEPGLDIDLGELKLD